LCSRRHGDGTLPNRASAIAIVELLRRYERRVDAVRVERADDDAAVQNTFGGVQRMRGEDLGEREIELE
jgi:hypothetical protein